MAVVRTIGEGYYGIETQGVSIDRDVTLRIDKAFEEAAAFSPKKLAIRRRTESSTPYGKTPKKDK